MQKIRYWRVVYHKTKNSFGANICMNSSFQLLLYIMKIKSQEDQYFHSLKFSDITWKPPQYTQLLNEWDTCNNVLLCHSHKITCNMKTYWIWWVEKSSPDNRYEKEAGLLLLFSFPNLPYFGYITNHNFSILAYQNGLRCYPSLLSQGSKFILGFGGTCATRCNFLGALPKF